MRQGSLPQFDTLSLASDPSIPIQLHEWLPAIITYVLFTIGGHAAVQLFYGVCVGCTGALLAFCIPGSAKARAYILLSILPLFTLTLSARPHLLGYFFLALLLGALQQRRLLLLPLILFVWAQCHASVILGLALAAVYLALLSLVERTRTKLNAAILISCAATITINPMGWDLFPFVFRSTERLYQLPLEEWAPLSWPSALGIYISILFLALIVAVSLRFKSLLKNVDSLACLLLCSVFSFEALNHARYFSIWAIFFAATLGYALTDGAPARIDLNIDRRLKYLFSALLPFYFICVCTFFGARLGWYPLDSIGIKELREAPAPRFTTYNTGGFNLWFDQKTKSFIDSRQDPFRIDVLMEAISAQLSGDLQPLFLRWGFVSALVESRSQSHQFLTKSGWIERWKNDQLAILVRPSGDNAGAP